MVFTNPIMAIHVNMTTNRPPMNSMVVGGYRSVNVTNPRGGYQEPFVITAQTFDHRDGHYVRPNMVAFKCLDFFLNDDLNVHVKVFNFAVKVNTETFEEYIINFFSYMLRDMASGWCHNYMLKFPTYIFLKLTQTFCKCHQKTQNDEQIYMELKNVK